MISTFNIPTKRLNLVQESEIRRLYLIYKLHFFLLFCQTLEHHDVSTLEPSWRLEGKLMFTLKFVTH